MKIVLGAGQGILPSGDLRLCLSAFLWAHFREGSGLSKQRQRIENPRVEDDGGDSVSGNLAERAHGLLEEMIVTTRLAPGSTWSEASICEEIGIGRTPVREALQRLAREQLVEIVPRYGVVVTEVSIPEQIMVVEIRRVLDPLIASRAARRASPREKVRIAEYRRNLMGVEGDGDVADFLRLHYAMRRFLSHCTRNKFLASAVAPIDALSRRFFFIYQGQKQDLAKAIALQSDILLAIVNEDEPAAVAAANRLVDHVEVFTRAALDSQF
jgi:DNA-binding GntR family transcriptional regulator